MLCGCKSWVWLKTTKTRATPAVFVEPEWLALRCQVLSGWTAQDANPPIENLIFGSRAATAATLTHLSSCSCKVWCLDMPWVISSEMFQGHGAHGPNNTLVTANLLEKLMNIIRQTIKWLTTGHFICQASQKILGMKKQVVKTLLNQQVWQLEIEASHIKTETPPDEEQEMLEDVLALDDQDYSSKEAQTEVDGAVDSEIRAALTSTSSVCNQQEGRLLQRTLRRKTKLTSSAPGRKQSLTKTQKEKRRHKSHRLTSSPSVKLKVSVDSIGTYAVSLGSKEQAWNPFREALKPSIHKVKKPKLSRKKRLTTQCSICYKLLAKFMLGRHMDTKHPGQAGLGDGFFHCKDCGEKFKLLSDLQAHSSAEHQVLKKFKCKICGMSFAKIRNLSLHTRLTHKLAYMKECDICGEGFQKWEELPKHRFKVHGVSDHPCHICGKSFVHEQALNAHLDAHAGVKKYFCEVCGKGFVRFTNLCTHKLTHTSKTGSKLEQSGDGSDNPHTANSRKKGEQRKCAMCIRAVVTKSSVCHLHGGQSSTRSYVCSVCGKRFMSSSHLSAHSKQHLEPRFSCDLCAKRFTYKCNLKSHRLSHLPLASKKIFHCQHCSKTFNTHNNLALHERTHEEPTYSCYVCAKGFTRSSNLYRHIRNMHPEHAR